MEKFSSDKIIFKSFQNPGGGEDCKVIGNKIATPMLIYARPQRALLSNFFMWNRYFWQICNQFPHNKSTFVWNFIKIIVQLFRKSPPPPPRGDNSALSWGEHIPNFMKIGWLGPKIPRGGQTPPTLRGGWGVNLKIWQRQSISTWLGTTHAKFHKNRLIRYKYPPLGGRGGQLLGGKFKI